MSTLNSALNSFYLPKWNVKRRWFPPAEIHGKNLINLMPKNTFSNCDLSIAYQFSYFGQTIFILKAKFNETTANLVVKLFYENDTENYIIHSDNYLFKHTLVLSITVCFFLWLIVDYALFNHFKTRWAFMRSNLHYENISYKYTHTIIEY